MSTAGVVVASENATAATSCYAFDGWSLETETAERFDTNENTIYTELGIDVDISSSETFYILEEDTSLGGGYETLATVSGSETVTLSRSELEERQNADGSLELTVWTDEDPGFYDYKCAEENDLSVGGETYLRFWIDSTEVAEGAEESVTVEGVSAKDPFDVSVKENDPFLDDTYTTVTVDPDQSDQGYFETETTIVPSEHADSGTAEIYVEGGGSTTGTVDVDIVENQPPSFDNFAASPSPAEEGQQVEFSGSVSDPEGDSLTLDVEHVGGPEPEFGPSAFLEGSSIDGSFIAPDVEPGSDEAVELKFTLSDGSAETVKTVEVPIENAQAEINDVDLPEGSYERGDTVKADVTVENPGDHIRTYYVGYSVSADSETEWRSNDNSTHIEMTVPAGATRSDTVEWTAESDAPFDEYDVLISVWEEGDTSQGAELEQRLDRFEADQVFEVNDPPTAEAGSDQTIAEGESVTLDGSDSTDQNDELDYKWQITSGSQYGSLESTSGQSVTFAADEVDKERTVTAQLEVDDGVKTDTDTVDITVQNDVNPPTADAGGPYTVNENERVSLDSSGSSDPDGEIVDREWAVTEGPGEIDSGEFVATGDITEDTAATVKLTVTDNDGATDTDTATVEIDANEPPTADAGGPYSVEEGESVELDSSGSADPDGQVTDRSWKVTAGPGEINGGTYTAPDSLEDDTTATVELTVTDDDGATTTDIATVTIGAVEEPFFDVSIDSVNDPVQEGETLEVDTTIQNLGDESDTQSVRLFADGTEVDSAEVTLDGGATTTETLSYETESGDADSVILRVETDDTSKERTAAVTAEPEEEAFFDVSIDNINDPVDVGDELTVTGTIENTGESTGTQDIEASIGGDQVGSEQLTLDGGESRTVSMSAETDVEDAPSVSVELQSANDTATQEATVEAEEDGSSDAERSIDRTTAQPGDTVEVTVSMKFEKTTTPAFTESFDTAFAEVERVDESPPALFAGANENNTEYVAAWEESEENYEATYRVTVPESIDTEDEIQINGTVTLEDTNESIEISGDNTIEIIDDPLVEYANDNGIITTDGMIDAFGDWQSGEISVDVLLEVFAAWQTGEPVA